MGCPVLLALAALLAPAAASAITAQEEQLFKAWMLQNGRRYGPAEYGHRLRVFVGNKRRIDEHNAGNHSFEMGLNQFSDLTFTEFKKMYLWREPQNCSATKGNFLRSSGPYPDSVDWRKKGNYVTPVKNQVGSGSDGQRGRSGPAGGTTAAGLFPQGAPRCWGRRRLQPPRQRLSPGGGCRERRAPAVPPALAGDPAVRYRPAPLWLPTQGPCGSCWTFSTTGCLESAIAIATGKLLSLAEQQLVDCAQAFNNHGCSGGLPSQAFEYIMYNKGLMGEDAYPYRAENGTCKFQPDKAIAFVKDVINITQYDEAGMVEAVGKYNPVSFAFEVTSNFMHYRKGVYSNPRCEHTPDKVNHAVLAVGYGEENGTPYWIVKNSWGPLWGMDGYFLIERGKNMCGLAACASYPIPQV
ncbi:pro-cathepsin H isoform X1 [Cygnus olor]|uniref:pro-cathepsin H isoform X1 n=1 Tax=Cygnus atratus TaxID=8868 RepID=UPI0015D6418A|nr:pro-cathepsin H isoform X1 [Cygnus atratus]XP_040426024.1 pro-cathepsin H isoform X1 [Cygnus olor]